MKRKYSKMSFLARDAQIYEEMFDKKIKTPHRMGINFKAQIAKETKKKLLRKEIEADVQAFILAGGKIKKAEENNLWTPKNT